MELVEDIKNKIASYLDNKITTILSKKIRHNYFRENGVYYFHDAARDDCVKNLNLLRKYDINMTVSCFDIVTSELIVDFSEMLDQEILDRVTKLRITYAHDKNFGNFESMKNLISVKGLHIFGMTTYPKNLTDCLENIRAKKPTKITNTYRIPDDSEIYNRIKSPNFEMTFFAYYESNHIQHIKNQGLLEKITEIRTGYPLHDIYPKLRKLTISPSDLLASRGSFPELTKIKFTTITREIFRKIPAKYPDIKRRYRHNISIVLWDDINDHEYAEIRQNCYYMDRVGRDKSGIKIFLRMELLYRSYYPNSRKIIFRSRSDLIIAKYVTDQIGTKKMSEIFDIVD